MFVQTYSIVRLNIMAVDCLGKKYKKNGFTANVRMASGTVEIQRNLQKYKGKFSVSVFFNF